MKIVGSYKQNYVGMISWSFFLSHFMVRLFAYKKEHTNFRHTYTFDLKAQGLKAPHEK